MLASGLDVDALTGEPRESQQARARDEQARRAQDIMERSFRLQHDLAGAEGSVLRETLTRLLLERIDTLLAADAEAQGYLKLLSALGYELAVGQRVAAAKVAAVWDGAR